MFFGSTGSSRFDAPSGEYGVLYVAVDVYGAFIETFGRRLGRQSLQLADFATRALARVTTSRPLRLVDLAGVGLPQVGADARLTTGDYRLAHRWALALYQHPEQPDGLLYRSRHDPSRLCAAIFDRAADALSVTPLGSLADRANAALLADILDTYGFGLIE